MFMLPLKNLTLKGSAPVTHGDLIEYIMKYMNDIVLKYSETY